MGIEYARLPIQRAALLPDLERSFRIAARHFAEPEMRPAHRRRSVSSLLRRISGLRRSWSRHHAQRASPERHLHVVGGRGRIIGPGARDKKGALTRARL